MVSGMVKIALILMLLSGWIAGCSLQPVQVDVQTAELPASNPTGEGLEPANPLSGGIVFIGSDGNIQLSIDSSGPPEKLTTDARTASTSDDSLILYREPTWSPAGDRLAFVRNHIPIDAQVEHALEVFDLSTKSSSRIWTSGNEAPIYLYWSPDGRVLSFLSTGAGDDLNLWTSLDGREAQIIDRGQPYFWTWLADSKSLLAHSGGSVEWNPDVARLQFVEGGQNNAIDLGFSPLNFQAPLLSPTGEELIVAGRSKTGESGLFMLSLEGEVLAKLGTAEVRFAFDFSPSGRFLAIVSGPESDGFQLGNLTVVDLDDPGDLTTSPVIAEDVAAFWWAPGDDRLLYFMPGVLPENFAQPISFGNQGDGNLRVQASVYDSVTESSYPLMLFEPTRDFFRLLPYYDQYQRSATIWSPDGSHVVYSAVLTGREPGIFIIDVDGGTAPIEVGKGTIAFWSFR